MCITAGGAIWVVQPSNVIVPTLNNGNCPALGRDNTHCSGSQGPRAGLQPNLHRLQFCTMTVLIFIVPNYNDKYCHKCKCWQLAQYKRRFLTIIKATRLIKSLMQEIVRSGNSNTEFGCKSLGMRLRFAQREVRTKSLGMGRRLRLRLRPKGSTH